VSTTSFRLAQFGTGSTGLVGTVGYALVNPDNTVNTARTTSGITERPSGSGTYAATVTLPNNFQGELRWDTGGGSPKYASEVVNQPSLPAVLALVQFGSSRTGLVGTVGYTLVNPDNSVAVARTTAGITERPAGSGTYAALVTPPTAFVGEIRWDTGGTPKYASDTFSATILGAPMLTLDVPIGATPFVSPIGVPFNADVAINFRLFPPQNVTGWNVKLEFFAAPAPAVPITPLITAKTNGSGITITDAANGVFQAVLTATDTGPVSAGLGPGSFTWSFARTDSGSQDLLGSGPFAVILPRPL